MAYYHFVLSSCHIYQCSPCLLKYMKALLITVSLVKKHFVCLGSSLNDPQQMWVLRINQERTTALKWINSVSTSHTHKYIQREHLLDVWFKKQCREKLSDCTGPQQQRWLSQPSRQMLYAEREGQPKLAPPRDCRLPKPVLGISKRMDMNSNVTWSE